MTARRLGRLRTLQRLMRAARYSRPGVPAPNWRESALWFAKCTRHVSTFRDWFGNADNPALQEALAQRPSLVCCVNRPYLNAGWTAARKLSVIQQHYGQLSRRLGFLRLAPDSALALADALDGDWIRLNVTPWFEHEGELTISLMQTDAAVYSLAFSLGQDGGSPVAYVGALQGGASADMLRTYRTMTRRAEGVRPRDLLIFAFRRFCRALGVQRILAVCDAASVCRDRYFRSNTKVLTSYDSAWAENGGTRVGDGFFELSPEVVPRCVQSIPSRKRAQYRRRYDLLELIGQQIDATVARSLSDGHPHGAGAPEVDPRPGRERELA